MRLLLAASLVLLAACAEPSPSASPAPSVADLAATVGAHTAAIDARDLDALMATVTAGDSLTLIFPDGTTLLTREQYRDFRVGWFANSSWTMAMQPVSQTVRDGLGVALLRTTYTDAAGPRGAMLALTFAPEDGAWRLVFDQNTRISE